MAQLQARIDKLTDKLKELGYVEQALASARSRARARGERIACLERFARAARKARDVESVTRAALACAMAMLPGDAGMAVLMSRHGRTALSLAAARDEPEWPMRPVHRPPAAAVFEQVRVPELLLDMRCHPMADDIRALVSEAVNACGRPPDTDIARTLLVPLFRRDDTPHGLLVVLGLSSSDSAADDLATADDLSLLETLAHSVECALTAVDSEREAEALIAERTRALRRANEQLEHELAARDRAHAELLAARDSAEAHARSKASFMAKMSHEIRTPLNGIVGTVELLRADAVSREQREQLDVLRACVSSLQTLVGDVLDFSRIEAGFSSLDMRPFLLGDVVESTYQTLQYRRRGPHVGFDVLIDEHVPDVVIGDPERLAQVLGNLCDNALKFTSQGQVTLRIRVLERSEAEYADEVELRFEVEDTGIGIAPEQLECVFQPFRQADSTTSHTYGGSGLGLAICKQLVEAMGGEIGVTSTLGIGSRFWFSLTLEVGSDSDLHARSSDHTMLARADASSAPASQVRQVLLVEDNPINQKVSASLLERLGCHTWIASNGVEAVAAARTRRFDLIFMDCQMPHMDGYQAATEIRRLHGHTTTPIIALTANASHEDRVRCIESGMNDYLAKPVTAKRLGVIMSRWAARQPEPVD